MRSRMLVALIFLTATVGPAAAQDNDRGGIRTETQDRLVSQVSNDVLWNSIGLIGLLGLLGFRRRHGDDSYHPASME